MLIMANLTAHADNNFTAFLLDKYMFIWYRKKKEPGRYIGYRALKTVKIKKEL